METEIWKEIKGYEGLFAVSNLGRVKSLARRVSNHTGFINKPERIMKHQFNRKGYPIVRLQDVDKYKKHFRFIDLLLNRLFQIQKINHK